MIGLAFGVGAVGLFVWKYRKIAKEKGVRDKGRD